MDELETLITQIVDGDLDVADIPADQLPQVRDQLVEMADAIRAGLETSDDPGADADALEVLADRYEAVTTRLDEIEADAAAERERAAAAAARFGQPEAQDEDDDEDGEDDTDEDDGEGDDEPEAVEDEPVVEDSEPVVEDEPVEAVAASGQPTRRRARARLAEISQRRPAAAAPADTDDGAFDPQFALTAGGSLERTPEGVNFETPGGLAEAFMEMQGRIGRIRRVDGEQRFHVARMHVERPIELTDDGMHNYNVLTQLRRQLERGEIDALTAAGGFCAPAEPSYGFFDISSTDGLLTLPTATARRGRVSIPQSTSMADIFADADWEAAVGGEWTDADDISAVDGDPTKPCFRVECPDFGTFEVAARPLCLTFGNFLSQFYPELVQDTVGKSLTAHAHFLNADLIADVVAIADSVAALPTTAGGAVIGVLRAISFHAAMYREKYRMTFDAPLEVVLPHWVRDALVVDVLARASTTDYAHANAAVNAWFAARNVRVQWVYDWQTISVTPAVEFPATVDILMFAAGTLVRLEAPTIDLGMVRDSTLNSTNDWQQFVESFAGIAKIGHEVRLIPDVPVCPSGATGQEEDLACAGS